MLRGGEKVRYEMQGERLTAFVSGEIDHHSAVLVRSDIDEKILIERPKTIALELSSVDFMDSSGLGLIMGRYNRITELGGALKIGNPSKNAERMLKMSGADKMIQIIYTEEGTE